MKHPVLLLISMATALILASGVASAALNDQADAGTVNVDGQVRTILHVGDRVYIGGDFTHVDGVSRNYLAAIDATTGDLVQGWNPNPNAEVRSLAASANGTRLYVGGRFTTIGGFNRQRLAAVDATTGSVDGGWNVPVNSSVRGMAVVGNRLYIGGDFSTVKGTNRTRLALVDGLTGALDPNWAPAANNVVQTLGVSSGGGRVYAGGEFTSVSGRSKPYLASIDASTGALDAAFQNPNPNGKVIALSVAGTRVYTAEGGGGGAGAAYDTTTGARAWRARADGNVQAVAVLADEVYLGGHFDFVNGQARQALAAVDAATGTLDAQWTPSVSPVSPGVWAMAASASPGRIYAGGDFTRISGQPRQRFAQFTDDPGNSSDTRILTAATDATIAEGAPTTNYGGATSLSVDGDTGSGRDEAALLRWDLSSIAPGAKVSSASVTLSVNNSSTQTYEAYALRRAWTEPAVTWNSYVAGLPWEVAGAKGSLDREATVAGSVTPSASGEQSFALPPGLVQNWVNDPASNRGIILADAANTDGMGFYSRESSEVGQRPRLTVEVDATSSP